MLLATEAAQPWRTSRFGFPVRQGFTIGTFGFEYPTGTGRCATTIKRAVDRLGGNRAKSLCCRVYARGPVRGASSALAPDGNGWERALTIA
jgi:hypothetical protein